jgi:hypothetical protein
MNCPRKQAIIAALRAFMNQRSGIEFGNYGDVTAFRAEQRSITKDLREAREIMRAVELSDSITADDLLKAAQCAFSGRLTIKLTMGGYSDPKDRTYRDTCVTIDYCTGQYFPTEYRRAVCAVLASALWEYTREHVMKTAANRVCVKDSEDQTYYSPITHRPVSAGDWLRAHFRKEFGRGIASRWFS